jgi:hypothetical protein
MLALKKDAPSIFGHMPFVRAQKYPEVMFRLGMDGITNNAQYCVCGETNNTPK